MIRSSAAGVTIGQLHHLASAASFKGIDPSEFLKAMDRFASDVGQAKNGMGQIAAVFRANGQSAQSAGPRLTGATGVFSRKVVGPGDAPPFHFLSDVAFPNLEALQACAKSTGGQEALAHAASISTGGAPIVLGTVDPD